MFGIDEFFTSKLLQRKNGQDYQCFKCGKWYSTRSIMLRHMNHECGMEKKIQCKLCYKKFRRKWNLEQHQKRIHKGSEKDDNDLDTSNQDDYDIEITTKDDDRESI
jgi:hypothetical protein